jgi:hypothetical protein
MRHVLRQFARTADADSTSRRLSTRLMAGDAAGNDTHSAEGLSACRAAIATGCGWQTPCGLPTRGGVTDPGGAWRIGRSLCRGALSQRITWRRCCGVAGLVAQWHAQANFASCGGTRAHFDRRSSSRSSRRSSSSRALAGCTPAGPIETRACVSVLDACTRAPPSSARWRSSPARPVWRDRDQKSCDARRADLRGFDRDLIVI